MRAYFFGNMYLSSIQQGIQAAHAVADMFVKYDGQDEMVELKNWAYDHKTMILLNGGYSENIRALVEFFDSPENPYPWVPFFEGQDALDGALTTVGIVLPEKIYEASRIIRTPARYLAPGIDPAEEKHPREMIWDDGELRLFPDNDYGVEVRQVDAPLVWEYNKWEAQLLDKLNEFGLAR